MKRVACLVVALTVARGWAFVCDTSAAWREEVTQKALKILRDDGSFNIILGNMSYHANVSNPVGVYGSPGFPQSQPKILCDATYLNRPNGASLCNFSYVFGDRDAVVWLGCTPPPLKYFSVRSHTEFRFDDRGKPYFWPTATELGDPINQLLMNTTAKDPADFNAKTTLVISVADAETERKIRSAFIQAGFPEGAINVDIVASEKARFRHRKKLWLKDRSDAISLIFRASEFEDPNQAHDYMSHIWPAYFFEAKPSYIRREHQPLYTESLRNRTTGETQDYLKGPLQELMEAVTHDLTSQGYVFKANFLMNHTVPDLDRCLTDPHYYPIVNDTPAWNISAIATCGHYTRDALYTQVSEEADLADLVFPDNRVYVLLGVNQPLVGTAVYSNLIFTANDKPQKPGHTANFSSSDLSGSASVYSSSVSYHDQLFAVKIARECQEGDRFCRVMTEEEISLTEFVFVLERKYLNPKTKIGPPPDEILLPVVLAFEKTSTGSSSSISSSLEEDEGITASAKI